METRRYLIFFVVSFFVLWGWGKFVVPLIIPPAQNEQVENEQAENKQGENEEKANENQQQKPLEQSKLEHPSTVLVAARPGEAEEQTSELPTTAKEFANLVPAAITEPRSLTKANSSSNANSSSKNETNNKVENKVENAELKIPQHEVKTVWLGSLKEESGYYLMVELNSKGAVLTSVRMNDPRFKELDDREEPLTVIGHTRNEFFKTFQLKVDHLDKLLQKEFGLNLNEIHWKIEQQVADENDDAIVREVTFSLAIPGESLEVRKVYRLHTVEPRGEQLTTARKELPDGYWIDLDIQLVNQSLDQIKTNYTLQGPVGLPLENADNTRKFRDIQRGIQDGDEIKQVSTSASEVLEYAEEERPVRWTGTLQYIGIDVQYFAALLHPLDDQQNNPYIAETQPMLIKEDEDYESRCDISFKLISDELRLAPESETSHHYRLFVGPKREALLAEPLKATEVLNYGVFGAVAKFMLWILNSLHDKLSIPYGIAIIILTMIVRAALFPLSKKQALSAQKMKELQPEIKALQKNTRMIKRNWPGHRWSYFPNIIITRSQVVCRFYPNFQSSSDCIPHWAIPSTCGWLRSCGQITWPLRMLCSSFRSEFLF